LSKFEREIERLFKNMPYTNLNIYPDLIIYSSMALSSLVISCFEVDEQMYSIVFNHFEIQKGFNDEHEESLCHELEHYNLTKLLKSMNVPTDAKGYYPEWITSNPSESPYES